MYVSKNFSFKSVIMFSGGHIIWLTLWASLVTVAFEFAHVEWFIIPWLPIAAIGTAVAFYIGFKNNSAYDRLWEARKIWGAIVNSSRMWGTNVKGYITNQFTKEHHGDEELKAIHQRLIYRHIAWLYTLRKQLLIPTQWEHVNQNKHVSRVAKSRIEKWGAGLFEQDISKEDICSLLPEGERETIMNFKNSATQLIDKQSQDLKELRTKHLVDDFRHVELQKVLNDFYTHQGKAERIKKFPLPRQYGSMSFIFVAIFIFLLPLGMVSEFHKLGEIGVWLSIPFTVIVGWVFVMMELIGDYSENPFEGLGNDIPMLSLCRTIEIDLREMLGETDLPEPIGVKNDVLM